jgi:hypothetical protein
LFIADEVPFFIESCFSSFSLLSKNVRKVNASLGLVAQGSKNLIFFEDRSLFTNAETNILFTFDGDEESANALLKAEPGELEIIKSLRVSHGNYSQFYVRNSEGGKVGHLIINQDEYWASTTHPPDLALVHKVKKAFPEISPNLLMKVIAENHQTLKVEELA